MIIDVGLSDAAKEQVLFLWWLEYSTIVYNEDKGFDRESHEKRANQALNK